MLGNNCIFFKGLSFKPMGFLVKDNIGMWMLKTFLSKKVTPLVLKFLNATIWRGDMGQKLHF